MPNNNNDYMDVVVPIDVGDKTIWHKVGTAFPNRNPDKKHKMVISMVSIPLSMFTNGEVKMFIFPKKDRWQQRPKQQEFNDYGPRPDPIDDDVAF